LVKARAPPRSTPVDAEHGRQELAGFGDDGWRLARCGGASQRFHSTCRRGPPQRGALAWRSRDLTSARERRLPRRSSRL